MPARMGTVAIDHVDATTDLCATCSTFATKTSCDVDGAMAYIAPDSTTYIDARLGWVDDSHAALRSLFEQYMPNSGPPARTYAHTRARHRRASRA